MTDCNRQPLLFSSLGRQEVRADFAGGTLTSDAGGLLLREVDRQLGLIDALSAGLTDPRDPAKVIHEQRTMLAQRLFGLALGCEDLNDHDELRRDPLFSVLADKPPKPDEPLASSPIRCRLENRVDRKALARLGTVLVEQFIASFDQPPGKHSAISDQLKGKRGPLRVACTAALVPAAKPLPTHRHPSHTSRSRSPSRPKLTG